MNTLAVIPEGAGVGGSSQGISNPVLPGALGNPGTTGGQTVANFIYAAINLGLVLGVIYFFVYLIWGAIDWISSGGDKQKLESARGKITNALVGLVVLFAIFAVLRLIEAFFHIQILSGINFSQLQIKP